MGRYIDDILQPGEKVLYSTNAHWIFFLPAIIGWIAAAAFLVGLGAWCRLGPPALICLSLAAIAAIAALYKTATAWFHRWTTETDVTNFRVVHKEGFIKRQTFEMSVDKVESVDVNQSILGRIFSYGDVTVLGVGEGGKTIEMIASPLVVSQRHHRTTSRYLNHGHAAELLRRGFSATGSTVDPGRSREILETVRRVVGPQGQDGPAAQDQSAAARLYP